MSFDRTRLPEPAEFFAGQQLRLEGKGKWRTTRCAFHGGSDSMRINLSTGGWCCMACDAKGGDVLAYWMQAVGCDFVSAAKALGAWVNDGKEPTDQRPTPLPARQALQVLAFESTLVAVAAGNVAKGLALSADDLARLTVAAGRINRLAEAYQ